MSTLARLTRALEREARALGQVETVYEPMMTQIDGVSGQPGWEPYLLSFRMTIPAPELGGQREYTVTIVESVRRR